MQLFDWYDKNEYNKYIGPYFPMIQSSGMGKTRLFMELKKLSVETDKNQPKYFTFLCKNSNEDYDSSFFNGFIDAELKQGEDQAMLRQRIVAVLDTVFKKHHM